MNVAAAIQEIRTALRTRFVTVIDDKTKQVAWEGRVYTPVKGTPYWSEWLVVSPPVRTSIVPIRLELTGTYFIDVFDLPGRGNKAVLDKAGAILDAFGPDGLQLTSGGVTVAIGSYPRGEGASVGPTRKLPDWTVASVMVPWSASVFQDP